MKIRLFAFMLVLCLVLGLATGCNGKKNQDASSGSNHSGEADSSEMGSEGASSTGESGESQAGNASGTKIANGSSKGTGGTSKASGGTSSATKNEVNHNLKVSDYIRDASVSAPKYLNEKFEAYTDYGRNGKNDHLNVALVEKSIKDLKLGELYYSCFDGYHNCVGEWEFSFLNIFGRTDGAGVPILDNGWRTYKPTSRKDALARIKNWLFKQYSGSPYNLEVNAEGMSSMNGNGMSQHYACEFGFDAIGSEIGENIASHQVHMAFTRGAARQYEKVGLMYFSNWWSTTIGTWEQYSSWGHMGGPTLGHSTNLLKRSYMMSYMGGASSFTFEAGGRLAFAGGADDLSKGYYKLSPYGEAMKELVAFSTDNPDVGINYTPIGMVLDYYHGITNYTTLGSAGMQLSHDKAFGYFANTAGDDITWSLFNLYFPENLFGGKNLNQYLQPVNEDAYQVNSPYGDTCDVLLQNASQKVLNSYPCLLLSGNITLSPAEAERYVNYVKQGGTLILNTAYLKYFSSYKAKYTGGGNRQDIKDDKGVVIVYGPDYGLKNLDSILREQLAKFIPFNISKDVQYLVNVKNGSLIVTLINNERVRKVYNSNPTVDSSKAKDLQLKYTGKLAIQNVKELTGKSVEKVSGNTVNVHLDPGEYKVYEFIFG